jgi:hypothetical protein
MNYQPRKPFPDWVIKFLTIIIVVALFEMLLKYFCK